MSNLSCDSWMQSQQGLSPCATAELVDQACVSNYTISTTNFQESQYIPNTTTANPCTCSWASYNLLSACASCIGQAQLASWSTWSASCGSYVSTTTYFPYDLGYRLPTGKTIPYFSGTNPQTWTNETFNPTQASTVGSGVTSDLTGAPVSSATPTTSSSSKTSVGAIVGGVVGGVAVLLILIGFIFFVLYLRRRRLSTFSLGESARPSMSGARFVTIPATPTSTLPRAPNGILQSLSSSGPQVINNGPTTPHIISPYVSPTHGHSTSSLQPLSFASPTSTNFTAAPLSPPITDAADMISPFLATSSSRPQQSTPASSKAAEAMAETVLSPPGQRARMNPPPYTPTSPTSPTSPSPPANQSRARRLSKRYLRKANQSIDSTHSVSSTRQTDKQRPSAPRVTSAASVDTMATVATANDVGRADEQTVATVVEHPESQDEHQPVV